MLWILLPIAVIIIAIVIAFPVWFTHRRMRMITTWPRPSST